jgi:hypothetical protein
MMETALRSYYSEVGTHEVLFWLKTRVIHEDGGGVAFPIEIQNFIARLYVESLGRWENFEGELGMREER